MVRVIATAFALLFTGAALADDWREYENRDHSFTIHFPAAPTVEAATYQAAEQNALIDKTAERVQTLGGVAVGDPRHVAEITQIPRAPDGCEEVPAMLSRLLEAHELILIDAHEAAAKVGDFGDDGTNDLIVSEIIRTGELQSWFLVEHLVDTPLVRA